MSAASHTISTPNSLRHRPARARSVLTAGLLAAGSIALAACGATTPTPKVASVPKAPSAPVVETVPYRPVPPGGAHYVMDIPGRGVDGKRLTVNANLTDDQLVWNLRSAWNVAALNCLSPEYQPILDGYKAFLNRNTSSLKGVNDRLERSYNSRFKARRDAIVARDGYTTKVYNFFSLPPARSGFCNAALDMSKRALATPPKDPLTFARANFEGLVAPFEQFFVEYEAYQVASAEWDAKYGAKYGPSQPGWVAVHQQRPVNTASAR